MTHTTTKEKPEEFTTESFLEWYNTNPDKQLEFLINKKIPHTLFNVACNHFDSSQLQAVDWFTVFKTI